MARLKERGIRTVMLTGDSRAAGEGAARELGIDQVCTELMPADKVDKVEELLGQEPKRGRLAFVGDGINDAPVLSRADVGIAMGALGSDAAIEAADVVLMKSSLRDVPAALRLSRATLRNIHENLFWAFFYNTIGIPLAMGVFIPLGLTLNPMFGAAAMSLSSFCVVSNALRLNLFKLYDPRHDHRFKKRVENNTIIKETNTMTKTMKIKGMMCGHCEARVKKALEALSQVESAEVSHESGTAVVTLNGDISDGELRKAVEEQDYEVVGIE